MIFFNYDGNIHVFHHLHISVAYRYRKSILIMELVVSIYIDFLASIFSDLSCGLSKIAGWAKIKAISICRRVRKCLISWGQKTHVKHYNVDLSS